MVNPITANLPLYRNDDYGEIFYFTDGDQALDFTGYTGELQLRRYEDEPGTSLLAATVDCTVGGGGIEITISRESIDDLPASPIRGKPARFVYDLRLNTPSGDKEVWMRGDATVFGGVTR